MQGRPDKAPDDSEHANNTSVIVGSSLDNGIRPTLTKLYGSSSSRVAGGETTGLNGEDKPSLRLSTEKSTRPPKHLALPHTESNVLPDSGVSIPLESRKQQLVMDNSVESQRARRARTRNPWICSGLTFAVTVLALLILSTIVYSYRSLQVDPQGCRTPSMRPTYIKLLGFDSEHTRFASKYGLYLYRERGVDEYNEQDIGV